MARIRVPLTSFDFGEVSPSLTSRTDVSVYTHAAARVRNFFIKSEGGVEKRSGTRNWYTFNNTYSSSATGLQVRIEPFIFSDDERYIIAFSAGEIDVFILDPANNYEPTHIQNITQDTNAAALPWSQPQVIELSFAQQADVMFLCHKLYPTQKLVRTGLQTFQVEPFEFEESTDGNLIFQPYFNFQGNGVTITSSATTGSTTLTTSASYFVADHVGVNLRIGGTDVEITAVTNGTTATGTISGTIRQQLDIDALETVQGSNIVLVTHALHGLAPGASITIDRASGVGGLSNTNINGARTVGAVINENVYEITAGANATTSSVGGGSPRVQTGAATTEWEEQSYSSLRGYPSTVTFHEGRLWFAGSLAQPSNLWASKSNNYFNFNLGDGEDDEAIDLSANVGSFDQIRHLISNRDLQVFTSDSEFYVPSFANSPVTPATAQVKRQTPFGANFVKPVPFDGATLYVQKTESAIREYIFSDTEGAYVSTNISTLSPHLIRNPIQQALIKGALNKPESYAFYVNSDGTIAVFYSLRADKKAGWSLWDTEGKFHSACSVGERLFTVAVRDNGAGTDTFYLEEFDNSMPMDHCNLYTGTAGVLTGLNADFADGAVVKAVNGTDYLGTYTVTADEVDVSAIDTVTSAYVGYSFTPELQTLPIDGQISNGPLTGTPRRITSVILDLYNTLSVSVDGTDMIIRNVNDDFALGRSAFSGKKEFFVLGFSRDPQVTISQNVPLDLQLNGMVLEVAF